MAEDYGALLAALKRRLPADKLDSLGIATSFIKRVRAITAPLFVWAVVLSRFGSGRPGFTQARLWFERLSGKRLFPRPFQIRFKSRTAVKLFEATFEQAVAPWRRRPRVSHPLGKHFPDVFVWDASPVQLDDSLRSIFKGLHNAASQVKILLGISALGLLPLAARIVSGHHNDLTLDPPLELLEEGTLVLFDKGFVTYDRLHRMHERRLKYVCLMRQNAHAWITGIHAGPARLRKALKKSPGGISLRDMLPRDKRVNKVWDLEAVVYSKKVPAAPTPVRVRLVILPGRHGVQRPYLTNLDTGWSPAALRELYRLRWQIELVFKELKQSLNLKSVPTKDPDAVLVLLWASLIALAISRTIAAHLVPILRKPGFAAPIRLAVVSRALRSRASLVAVAIAGAPRLVALALQLLVRDILLEARRPRSKACDSFARLERLAPNVARAA